MSEKEQLYIVTDDDGDKTVIGFVSRACGCGSLGCVDDQLRVYDDGVDEPPFEVEISRYISHVIAGILDGDYTIKKEEPKRASKK